MLTLTCFPFVMVQNDLATPSRLSLLLIAANLPEFSGFSGFLITPDSCNCSFLPQINMQLIVAALTRELYDLLRAIRHRSSPLRIRIPHLHSKARERTAIRMLMRHQSGHRPGWSRVRNGGGWDTRHFHQSVSQSAESPASQKSTPRGFRPRRRAPAS